MLILTRKIGETIRIGDNITVKVLALRGGQIRLGFTAPNDVRIFREEVLLGTASAPVTSEPRAPAQPAHTPAKPPARGRLDSHSVRSGNGRQG
jgi:carbon storage regulator